MGFIFILFIFSVDPPLQDVYDKSYSKMVILNFQYFCHIPQYWPITIMIIKQYRKEHEVVSIKPPDA
jgi:hypothetical protein